MSRVGIVVIAAVMVEVISIIQYERVRNLLMEEIDIRGRVTLGLASNVIGNVFDITEATMKENLWEVRRSLSHPDSTFTAMVHLIDDNPYIQGGWIAFVPDYYPAKGRLFEPYAFKAGGSIVLQQLGGDDHDYSKNDSFQKVLETGAPAWLDPYYYGPDSLGFTTYTYPIRDSKGRLAAVCGLDLDLSWLGDTLNVKQPFPSSFALLLTGEGKLVAGPPDSRVPKSEVDLAVEIINGTLPESAAPGLIFRSTNLQKDPYWKVVRVHKSKEVFAPMKRMRVQNMFLILLGLAILAFMINRFANNEKKLRKVSEEQARVDGELEIAKRIQKEMIPQHFPEFVYGSLEPAREVGGDIFDFYIRDGKLFFCIGDVTGKGVPSAMLMSVAHSLFRMVSQKEESPAHILKALNSQLCQGNESSMFITFFTGCLDLYSGVLNYCNAGHDKPFVLTDRIDILQTNPNLPLGAFPDTRYADQTCTLSPGTTLLLYTDGLTEAKNAGRKAFGRNGVTEVLNGFLAAGSGGSLVTLISSMSEGAHRFAGEAPQSDDLTMLAIRFAPEDILREQIELCNRESEVTRLGDFVKGFTAKLGLDNRAASGLRLALEEAVVNVIDYAYPAGENGSILVQADSNHSEVRFTIVDSGIPFDPTSVLEADTKLDASKRPIGGLGVLLSRKLTDSVSYSRRNGQNVLTLTKSIV